MAMATDRRARLAIPVAAALLLWPALWNGYPIVFADTGTYLSQAMHRYAGWDRPVFYSVFMFALHWGVTVWPVVVAQALIVTWVLWLCWRWGGGSATWFVAVIAGLAATTWLPWLTSELMPDFLTPLLVLAMGLLAFAQLARWERTALAALATFAIACQLSSVPLAIGLAISALLIHAVQFPSWPGLPRPSTPRRADHDAIGQRAAAPPAGGDGASNGPLRRVKILRALHPHAASHVGEQTKQPVRCAPRRASLLIPPALAVAALCGTNLAAHGRFAIAPFGNVFQLARVIYDGPGMATLRSACPSAGWRLCPYVGAFPPDSDTFLWTQDSPLYRAGGPKAVSAEASAIIRTTLRQHPLEEATAAIANSARQAIQFASGDGLNAWPAQVTPWLEADFPAREYASYQSARQQHGALSVPLGWVHPVVSVAGLALCLGLLRKPNRIPRTFVLLVIIALPLNAAICGALSGPHDRYQARVMWLPPFVAALTLKRPLS